MEKKNNENVLSRKIEIEAVIEFLANYNGNGVVTDDLIQYMTDTMVDYALVCEPTNRYVYENGELLDSYPCDINGSNESVEYLVLWDGKKYVVNTDWNEEVMNPDAKAIEWKGGIW